VDDQNAALLSDSYRFIRMLSAALTTTSVFGSMHWTLVELERPLIATSDHPVVLWPGSESRAPQAVQVTEAGIMRCSKVRLPLSPFRAVLMTWADQADEDDVRVSGRAITLQTSTPSQSPPPIGKWFHQTGRDHPTARGRVLSAALVRARTRRWQRAAEIVNAKVGHELADREIEVVRISRPGT
jgi:hypothetical protein